jgi:predicted HicB family RNase H-like nuclease
MAKGKWGETMMTTMEINGYRAVIQYDPEVEMFRGEFVGLNGGADFYAKDIDGLRKEGEISLKVFLDMCREDGVEPRKEYSGKFNLRVSPKLHAEISARAAAAGKSLNQWVADVLDQSVSYVEDYSK